MTAKLSQLRRTASNAMCRQMAYERDGVYWSLRTDSGAEEATRYPTTTQSQEALETPSAPAKTDAKSDV